MKRLILTLLLVCFSIGMANNCTYIKSIIKKSPALKQTTIEFDVAVTMYNASESQCDSDPLVTAGMYKINPNKASEHKWVALSRNLLKRWGGQFNYGDTIKIQGAGIKDGIYMVADCMNKRFVNRLDILETKGIKLYKFQNVKITKLV